MAQSFTLVFTDLVDSTALNSRLGDQRMAALWESHDAGSRALLRQWRGREIDRSDGFLAIFDAVTDAAGFLTDYHRLLPNLPAPIEARAGMHVGPILLRQSAPEDVTATCHRDETGILAMRKARSNPLSTTEEGTGDARPLIAMGPPSRTPFGQTSRSTFERRTLAFRLALKRGNAASEPLAHAMSQRSGKMSHEQANAFAFPTPVSGVLRPKCGVRRLEL